MPRADEKFWWLKAEGYEISRGRPASADPDASLLLRIVGEDTVVPTGALTWQPVSAKRIYDQFANIERPDELSNELPKLLGFCKKHGVPTDPRRPAYVSDILKQAQLFRQLKDTTRRDKIPIGIDEFSARIMVSLFQDATNLKLRMHSASLLDFMRYQAIRDFKCKMAFLVCDRCGAFFVGGPGADRRPDSVYCTPECQQRASDKRKQKRHTAPQCDVRPS
jgi:hypothetical protein